MTLEFPQPVHFLLVAPDARNHSIIDVKHKDTGALVYRKMRHMVPNLYALSLIQPDTYSVLTETQSLSSASKEKVIMLQEPENSVCVRQNSRLGFEWTFEWEGHKLRWVKESPLSNTLECRLLCTNMEICIAQYLPRNGIKGSYFGVYSVWESNLGYCDLNDPQGLKLAMMTILFTFFDKFDDEKRKKKDKDSYVLDIEFQDLTLESQKMMDQNKLQKLDLETEKMLEKAKQKEERRTEKQLKRSSAYSSTTTSPAISPIPSPSSSSTYTDTPTSKTTKRSASLIRSRSYSSRDTRNRSPNKLTSFLTPFTKVSAAPDDSPAQKPGRHHQRALSAGISDMSSHTSYNRY